MIYTPTKTQVGFSLVETLVAISILLIVIVGPINLVVNSARSTSFANDQVLAFFLAQEGIEIVTAVRDDFQLQGLQDPPPAVKAWDNFTDPSAAGVLATCFTGGCGVELGTAAYGNYVITDCSSGTADCRLYQNNTVNERARYTHDDTANEATKFTRVITINDSIPGQAEVVSTVTWRSDGQRTTQEVETATYLFDIYDR